MADEQTYHEVLDEVAELSAREFPDSITAVYVGGSVARGDFTPGRSDVDLYVVLAERDSGVEERYRARLDDLEERLFDELRKIDPDALSVAFTSEPEVERGESFLGQGFEYHEFVENGELLYGSDVSDDIPEPTRAEEREAARQALAAVETEYGYVQDRFTKELFSTIFRTLCIFLSGSGTYVGSKERAVALSRRHVDDERILDEIERAYSLYQAWEERSLTEDEFCTLLRSFHRVVPAIVDTWKRERSADS